MYDKERLVRRFRPRYVRWHDEHRHTPFRKRRLCCHCSLAARLGGRTNFIAENATTCVNRPEVDLLRKIETQLITHYLAGNQHNWRSITVTLEQTVNEVKATWTARTRARGKFAAQKSVRARGKSPYFLMSNMDPPHPASANGVGNIV
jgi:hypothetical protein